MPAVKVPDNNSLLDALVLFEDTNIPSSDSILAPSALPHTNRHEWLIDEVTTSFLDALAAVPDKKWRDALLPVPFKGMNGEKTGPKILVDVGGIKVSYFPIYSFK